MREAVVKCAMMGVGRRRGVESSESMRGTRSEERRRDASLEPMLWDGRRVSEVEARWYGWKPTPPQREC